MFEAPIKGAGRADFVIGNEIYEVKPITQFNSQAGKDQLQNYVDHSAIGTVKGTSLLTRIPREIHIKNFTVVSTDKLKITCDIACRTSTDPDQAGMIYYIPYNWRTENKTKMNTTTALNFFIFAASAACIGKQVLTAGAAVTAAAADRAAAMIIIIPTPVLNQSLNKFNPSDQS